MERNNLKDIIDGSMKMPEQEPGRSMWISKDLDVRMEIIMHLSNEQVDYVQNLQAANEMWEYLRKIYQPSDGRTKFFFIQIINEFTDERRRTNRHIYNEVAKAIRYSHFFRQ